MSHEKKIVSLYSIVTTIMCIIRLIGIFTSLIKASYLYYSHAFSMTSFLGAKIDFRRNLNYPLLGLFFWAFIKVFHLQFLL